MSITNKLARLWVFALLAAATAVVLIAQQPVTVANVPHVIVDTAPTTAVTGTFFQATQPVSIATLPALAAGSAVIGHVIVDTTSTTAVTQATAASLNATVVGTGTFATQSILTTGSAQIGHLEANQSVNVAQFGGTTAVNGSGTATGALRVELPTNGTGVVGLNAGTATIGSVKQTDGTTVVLTDPCQGVVKSSAIISMSSATTTRFIAPTSAKKAYICSMILITSAAENVALIEGTGGTCASSTAGIAGGTTAATGFNLAANTGYTFGNGGFFVFQSAGTNVDVCLITSSTAQLSGHMTYVVQ